MSNLTLLGIMSLLSVFVLLPPIRSVSVHAGARGTTVCFCLGECFNEAKKMHDFFTMRNAGATWMITKI